MVYRTFGILVAAALTVAAVPFSVDAGEPAGESPYVVVLGITQDGGYPQAGCKKECCRDAWKDPARRRHASSRMMVLALNERRSPAMSTIGYSASGNSSGGMTLAGTILPRPLAVGKPVVKMISLPGLFGSSTG